MYLVEDQVRETENQVLGDTMFKITLEVHRNLIYSGKKRGKYSCRGDGNRKVSYVQSCYCRLQFVVLTIGASH